MENLPSSRPLESLLEKAGISVSGELKKLEVGFSNDVYSVDERYILKIARGAMDNDGIERDVHYSRLLGDKLPVPQLVAAGFAEELDGRAYFIYHKIPGENLYNIWHQCDREQRRRYVHQIVELLRILNATPIPPSSTSWQEKICAKIAEALEKLRQKGEISGELITRIENLVEQNKSVLKEEKFCLTNWDLHFDNFLVADGKIVGFLDFEWCDVNSLDHQLVLIKRMVRDPAKFASVHAEQFVVKEDYAELLDWYREFYPEMFDFEQLDKRLALYAVLQCIIDISYFANNEEGKRELVEYLEELGETC